MAASSKRFNLEIFRVTFGLCHYLPRGVCRPPGGSAFSLAGWLRPFRVRRCTDGWFGCCSVSPFRARLARSLAGCPPSTTEAIRATKASGHWLPQIKHSLEFLRALVTCSVLYLRQITTRCMLHPTQFVTDPHNRREGLGEADTGRGVGFGGFRLGRDGGDAALFS